jgi:hypothetical protein
LDVGEHQAEAIEPVELNLLRWSQRTGASLVRKAFHVGMVVLRKSEFQHRTGSSGREVSLELNSALPGRRDSIRIE